MKLQLTDSTGCPEAALFADLGETELLRRNEPRPGLFMAETTMVIGRALDAGFRPAALLLEKKRAESEEGQALLERLAALPAQEDEVLPVLIEEESALKEITGYPLTRGALSAMYRKERLKGRDLLSAADALLATASKIAVLYDIMNPTNLGAIVRSAAALGIDALLLTPGCTDPLYRRAVRVSVGTVFSVPWLFLPDFRGADASLFEGNVVSFLQSRGFLTAAMALTDESLPIDCKELMAAGKKALFLGSEGPGLPPDVIEACDLTVKIPMARGVDSLNVAAASAVAFWQLSR